MSSYIVTYLVWYSYPQYAKNIYGGPGIYGINTLATKSKIILKIIPLFIYKILILIQYFTLL
jgi:hypothetical protein